MPSNIPADPSRERFPVLYCDPPWRPGQTGSRGAASKYDLMSTDDIVGMAPAIDALAADDATMLMWVTNNALPDGLRAMEAFGFRYITNAVWSKRVLGLGNYLRNTHELLLLGVRGKTPKVKFRGERSLFEFPRMGHSVKPPELYPWTERLFDGPYLELFARARPNSRSDWAIWGNEVDSDVSLLEWGYPVPSDFARQGTDGERSR